MYRFNVRKLVYAVLLQDTKTALIYDSVKEIDGPMKVGLAPKVSSGNLYGGGAIKASIRKMTGYDITLDITKVPATDRAVLLGNKIENGVVIEARTDQAPYIALGYEVEQTGNTREVVWLYKCSVSPIANEVQQTTENVNWSTDGLTLTGMARDHDGQIKAFGDTSDEELNFTDEMAELFFKSVPGAQSA